MKYLFAILSLVPLSYGQIQLPGIEEDKVFHVSVHAAVANPCSGFKVDTRTVHGTNIWVEMSYYAAGEPCQEDGSEGTFDVPMPAMPAGDYRIEINLARYGITNVLSRTFSIPHTGDWGDPLWIYGAGGVKPVFSRQGNEFVLVHQQRLDDPDLTYQLDVSTNLTAGLWKSLGGIQSVNELDGTFNEVTNRFVLNDANAYVRMQIHGRDREVPRRLYTYSFGGLENLSVSNSVELLDQLGYAGIAAEARGADDRVRLDEYYALTDQKGEALQVHAAFMAHRFDQYGFSDADHRAAIDHMAGKEGAAIWVWVRDKVQNGSITEPMVREFITGIFEYAVSNDVEVILYPHYNTWYPTVEDAMPLVEEINHPSFKIAVNLCHELMSDKGDLLADTFKLAEGHIGAVIISGALNELDRTSVSTMNYSTILSLDESEYDLRPYVKLIAQSGYDGPVGFINFRIPNPEDYLERTMKRWRELCHEVGLYER